MFEFFTSFHLLRPYFLILLLPALLLFFGLRHSLMRSHAWSKVVDAELLPHLLVNKAQGLQRYSIWVVLALWILSIFALSGPSWRQKVVPVYRSQVAQVIVLDLSPVMKVTDIAPNRLLRAKYKVRDILANTQTGQTAMVVFSQEPYVVSPLTEDTNTIAALINELDTNMMPVQGQNISRALQKAGELLDQAGYHQGHIILLTANLASPEDTATAQQLAASKKRISVLNLATYAAQAKSLQALAAAGNGLYVPFSQTSDDIERLMQHEWQHLALKAEKSSNNTQIWRDDGRYLIFLLLPFALLVFRRGWFEELSL